MSYLRLILLCKFKVLMEPGSWSSATQGSLSRLLRQVLLLYPIAFTFFILSYLQPCPKISFWSDMPLGTLSDGLKDNMSCMSEEDGSRLILRFFQPYSMRQKYGLVPFFHFWQGKVLNLSMVLVSCSRSDSLNKQQHSQCLKLPGYRVG